MDWLAVRRASCHGAACHQGHCPLAAPGEAAALAAAWATLPCRGEAAAIRTEPGPGMRGSDAGAPTVAAVRVLLLNDAGDDADLAA